MKICDKEVRIQGRLIKLGSLDADTYEFLENPEEALEEVRRCGTRIDLFTFMQRMPDTSPKYRYPMVWDNLAVLPVTTYDHWWTRQVNDKTRNMVRRAHKKGVTLRELSFDDELLRGIWTIYNECAIRRGKPFAHYGKDLDTVGAEAGTFLDRSTFIGAFLEEKLIGFVKLLYDETRTQAGLLHIISMIQHRDKAPTNALIAAAVRSCADRGIPDLVYSRFSDGNKQRDSLMDFKLHHGFQRINLPRYYVPITRAGAIAFRLGLHKRLADHVPEPILAKMRELRKTWYERKSQAVAQTS